MITDRERREMMLEEQTLAFENLDKRESGWCQITLAIAIVVLFLLGGINLSFVEDNNSLLSSLVTRNFNKPAASVNSGASDELLLSIQRQLESLTAPAGDKENLRDVQTTASKILSEVQKHTALLQEAKRASPMVESDMGAGDEEGEEDEETKTKADCELNFWNKKYEMESHKLGNSWYKRLFTVPFHVDEEYYIGKKVLDIGCGPRGSLEWASRAKTRACVDPLAISYGELGSNAHDMLYIQSGVESIPLPSKSFDIVTSINNFDHVADENAGISEVARILKPGGRFLLLVEIHPEPTRCEPRTFGWQFAELIAAAGFRIVMEEHHEGGNASESFTNPPFDHSDPRRRDGYLVAVFERLGDSDAREHAPSSSDFTEQ